LYGFKKQVKNRIKKFFVQKKAQQKTGFTVPLPFIYINQDEFIKKIWQHSKITNIIHIFYENWVYFWNTNLLWELGLSYFDKKSQKRSWFFKIFYYNENVINFIILFNKYFKNETQ